PRLTERIQHGVFKFGFIPLALYGILGAAMALLRRNGPGAEG
ncbi:MAG: 4Fe-4S dicluster domain-containing protein, partial [Deltaproteobacteria bacterium]|nr:4Fe-4S dicluster domain-containing protein [Deltaproteobacteria bacterium]